MPTKNINFQDPEKYFLTERMKKGESSFKIVHDDTSGTSRTYFDVNHVNVTLKDIKEFFELNKIDDTNSLLINGTGLTLFMSICMHVSRAPNKELNGILQYLSNSKNFNIDKVENSFCLNVVLRKW